MRIYKTVKDDIKNSFLIKESFKTGHTIVASDPEQVKNIKNKASLMGLIIKEPITFPEYLSSLIYGKKTIDEKFIICNIDDILDKLGIYSVSIAAKNIFDIPGANKQCE